MQKLDNFGRLLKFVVELSEYGILQTSYAEEEWIREWHVITNPKGNTFEYAIKLTFPAYDNEAEYWAAIAGLRMCIAICTKSVSPKMDSQLINGILKGEF